MIRKEDCNKGTELICIKTLSEKHRGTTSNQPPLTIKAEYSIKEILSAFWDVEFCLNTLGFCFTLNEVAPDSDGTEWVYFPDQFKLKYDPKALEIFKFKGVKQELENA